MNHIGMEENTNIMQTNHYWQQNDRPAIPPCLGLAACWWVHPRGDGVLRCVPAAPRLQLTDHRHHQHRGWTASECRPEIEAVTVVSAVHTPASAARLYRTSAPATNNVHTLHTSVSQQKILQNKCYLLQGLHQLTATTAMTINWQSVSKIHNTSPSQSLR